jgi:hypothetical protein
MKSWLRWCAPILLLVSLTAFALSQNITGRNAPRLPNGKSQQEEILKAQHEQNLKDAARLIEMAEQLKQELEKNDRHVLSISTLKKAEDIENLAKKIRSRLRR